MNSISSFDWIGHWARYKTHSIACTQWETKENYTYEELNNAAEHAIDWLLATFDLEKGDRLAVLAENSILHMVLFAVCQKTGIILVPLNYRLQPSEIEYIVNNASPKVIVVEQELKPKLVQRSGDRIVNFEEFEKKCSVWKSLQIANEHTNANLHENDTLFILYTSGTTAFPKGALYTHGMLFWNSVNTQLRLTLTSNDKSINCAPNFHTGSWNVLLTPFLHQGAFTVIMKKFEATEILKALSIYHCSIWWAVPTMLKMLAENPLFTTVDLSRLRYLVVGGEPMPMQLIELFHQRGIAIRQGYGLTEVGPNVTSLDHSDAIRKKGSIGTPNFYVQARIVNDLGENVAQGNQGELWLSGPNVLPGYWQNESSTKDALIDGWFKTGDIVKEDEEGYLFVVDRIKNMYISGGENVYPAEVERVILQMPQVKNVAIVGQPDEKWGEVGLAIVVLNEKNTLTVNELQHFCKTHLAGYKVPKALQLVDEIPLNESGKIDRKTLKKMFVH